MPKETYNIPMTLATAMATNRTQLLELVSSEEFKGEDVKRLLADLIQDRQESIIELQKVRDMARQLIGTVNAMERKSNFAIEILSGNQPEEETEED